VASNILQVSSLGISNNVFAIGVLWSNITLCAQNQGSFLEFVFMKIV